MTFNFVSRSTRSDTQSTLESFEEPIGPSGSGVSSYLCCSAARFAPDRIHETLDQPVEVGLEARGSQVVPPGPPISNVDNITL